ncbi:MAG: hypothetical protein ACRD51_17510, partial [Candidatus Acidiferrum sp.]
MIKPSDFPHRLPFHKFKPDNPPKPKGAQTVTLILGIQCKDGVVIGADTEVTADYVKNQESKLRVRLKNTALPCVFAFADNVHFSKASINRLG